MMNGLPCPLRARLARIEAALRELHDEVDDLAELLMVALYECRRLQPDERLTLPYRKLPRARTYANA